MKNRESGIDCIRCLGLLFVVGVHSFLKNGFYFEPQIGAAMWAADSFRWLFYGCNGIFMMLTGYLKSTKPLGRSYYRSLAAVLISYVLTCAVSFPIRHFLLGEVLTPWQWIEKMVTFANYGWYVEMYIGLFLISPLINLALDQLKTARQLLWAAGTMTAVSVLPTVTALNLIPDYWVSLYPVTYYVIGAVIRRLRPQFRPGRCLFGAALVSMGLGLVSLITTDEEFSDGFTTGYGGFWVVLTVTLLFLGIYQLKFGPKTAKVLAWASGGCFEGYILSRLLDVWIYDLVPQWHTPCAYPLIFVCITIPVFAASLLMGKVVHGLSGWIMNLKKPKQSCQPLTQK